MGVMSCYRPKCENIMCDVYVDDVGYICYECEKEFKIYLEKHGLNPRTEGEIKGALMVFMESDKDEHMTGNEVDLNGFFNQYRRDY